MTAAMNSATSSSRSVKPPLRALIARLPGGGCPGVVGGGTIGVVPGPVVAGGVVPGGCAPLPRPPGPMGGPCCCAPQSGVAPPSGAPTASPEMPLTVVTQPLSSPP